MCVLGEWVARVHLQTLRRNCHYTIEMFHVEQSAAQGQPFTQCPLKIDACCYFPLEEKCDFCMSSDSLYKASNDSYFSVYLIRPGKQPMWGLSTAVFLATKAFCPHSFKWAHGCFACETWVHETWVHETWAWRPLQLMALKER